MTVGQIQAYRVLVPRVGNSTPVALRVERALDLGGYVFVSGWRGLDVKVSLNADGAPLRTDTLYKRREDVASKLELADGGNLGFVLLAPYRPDAPLALEIEGQESEPFVLSVSPIEPDKSGSLPLTAAERLELSAYLPLYSDAWAAVISDVPGMPGGHGKALAHFEFVKAASRTGGAVASGWLMTVGDVRAVWIQSSSNAVFDLTPAIRRERKDVLDVHGSAFPTSSQQPGFVQYLPNVGPNEILRMRVLLPEGVADIAETTVGHFPDDPALAAEQIFSQSQPAVHLFGEYVSCVAAPVLEGLVAEDRKTWERLSTRVRTQGTLPGSPVVSIIVPLYGRIDFVEHQLIEFAKDEWILDNAEIVYVIDDPSIMDQFITLAPQLYAAYRVPFRYLWGEKNRGYSGANNLGAQHSTGSFLLFLNSDAFPQGEGWLDELVATLDARPDAGAVAPRLVFADGSIQHAGMTFRYRGDLDIWTNHHPHMGLDPSLDPAGDTIVEVPAATGACLLVRRGDFESAGGWDTGYLIGDFEDSDLCLKLRESGMKILYNPLVQLTHLERQSFALLGKSDFKFRVVIYNAMRHQLRWERFFKEQASVH